MDKNLSNNKHGGHFNIALLVIFLSIAVSLLAFLGEDSKLTGFATGINSESNKITVQSNLPEFNDVKSLSSMAAGNYYIDGSGIVYWTDDDSRPAVAKVKFIDESQKNRAIYIDKDGNLGYIIAEVNN